jgi:hypothetical protein
MMRRMNADRLSNSQVLLVAIQARSRGLVHRMGIRPTAHGLCAAFLGFSSLFGVSEVFAAQDGAVATGSDHSRAAQGLAAGPVVNVQLEATRLSGVAPLAVMFDASATTTRQASRNPFHEIRYAFDFGDDRGLKWPVSGLPKNVQEGGPLAAHVFDLPGTYQVKVRTTDPSGITAEKSVTVKVLDPNQVYAGSKTICVSAAGRFEGCPSGASHAAALPSSDAYSGRRVLLGRGEAFGKVSIPHGSENVQVGAFGVGAAPQVDSIFVGGINPSSSAFPRDITVMDLAVKQRFEQFVTMSRLLLYRNTFEVPTGEFYPAQINLASALAYIVEHHKLAANQYFQPRELFVVENRVRGSAANPMMNMAGEGSRFVILGNDMGTAKQHTVRIWGMHKGFIAHNALRGRSSDGIRVALKVHSGGLGDYNDDYAISGSTWASRQIVIANNRLGDASDNNSFTGGASPQNNTDSSREGLEDVILENNVFVRGPKTNTEFILMGRRMTSRGNLRADGGKPNINQFDNSYRLLPPEWVGPFYFQ